MIPAFPRDYRNEGRSGVTRGTLGSCSWWQVAWVGFVLLGPEGGVLGSKIPGCPLSLAECGWQGPTRRKSRRPKVSSWCPANRAWRPRGRTLNWKYFRNLQPESLPVQGLVPLQVALEGFEGVFRRLITQHLVYRYPSRLFGLSVGSTGYVPLSCIFCADFWKHLPNSSQILGQIPHCLVSLTHGTGGARDEGHRDRIFVRGSLSWRTLVQVKFGEASLVDANRMLSGV